MGTYTYVELELSPAAFDEISEKMEAAGYGHAFMDDATIDMHGIAVTIELPEGLKDPQTVLQRGREILKRWGL